MVDDSDDEVRSRAGSREVRLQGLVAELHAAAKVALAGDDIVIAARLVNAHASLQMLVERPREDESSRAAMAEARHALRDWQRIAALNDGGL